MLYQLREIIVDTLPVANEEYDDAIRRLVNLIDYPIITYPDLPESRRLQLLPHLGRLFQQL
jgi:hypothetical protein